MSVNENQKPSWTEPGHRIECQFGGETFHEDLQGSVRLELAIDEVLEEFDTRRVLVASVHEILGSDHELSDDHRQALTHPTYLIEETSRLEHEERQWPTDVEPLVRAPVAVEEAAGIRRSIFVDNVGISVGDLVDLVRGQLAVEQVELVFRAVADLFTKLHAAGWVHLGLTPWNVRIYDPEQEDGFPRLFLSADSEDTSGPDAELNHEISEVDEVVDDEENPFGSRERTVVELNPLGNGDEEADAETDEQVSADGEPTIEEEIDDFDDSRAGLATSSIQESEVSWAQVSGDTADAEVETPPLAAILDGIDRLYPTGTIDDEIAVTPGFSSPELLSGMGSESGTSADVFSLGMFLYFLVSGVVPPASIYTRYGPAIPARNFRPTFPPGLQSVISRATRPRPEDRFSSVSDMIDAFDEAFELMTSRAAIPDGERPTMRLEADTHIGIAKKRRNPTNQDSVFSATSEDGRFALVVVADGVSTASYGSGDLASHALTEAAAYVWNDILSSYLMDESMDSVEVLQSILNRANHRIVKYVNENHTPFRGSPHEVMGTTALVAVIEDGLVTLASLGDSRVYLQRGAGLEQMTIDHNLWTLSILEGVPADTALAMPHGDALARCLGTFVVDGGELEAVNPQPDLFRFQVMEGDTLLMTTDGLVDFAGTNLLASEDNILAILLAEPDPALACLELILLANRGGGGDNIGLSVVRFY